MFFIVSSVHLHCSNVVMSSQVDNVILKLSGAKRMNANNVAPAGDPFSQGLACHMLHSETNFRWTQDCIFNEAAKRHSESAEKTRVV